ncbi:unnamed protein product [Blepharisma stoltei]|uniref:dAMP1 SANT/Myb-like domain-containing protein n=1 Tax=Blepharisma stoltei TaxID=1481888 RepID=A0AAU9IB01_9CILI|nr:unnamed protein product [Blepharisma stoltei]
MDDIKDILSIPRADSTKKSEIISREVINLTGGIPPMKPSLAKKALKAIKEKRVEKTSTEKWIYAPFKNSAREDDLQLCHWKKSTDKEEDYAFSKFNKKIELIDFTDEEYDSLNDKSGWSKEETLYLWSLCREYDLRFIIIQDRYDVSRFCDRTVEDIKERYYYISKAILQKREIEDHPIIGLPYNANYERKRKALLEKYFLRTKEQDDEEKALCEEARKLDIRIKKEEKEMKNYEKLMSSNSEEIDLPEWSTAKKEPPKAPILRSYFLTQPTLPSRLQRKIETILKVIGIPDRPMPTQEVVELYEKLKRESLILLNLQKHVIKKEIEKKSLEDKIREVKNSANKKSSGGYSAIKNTQAPAILSQIPKLPTQVPIRNPVATTKQTIQPMNNLQQTVTSKRVSGKVVKAQDSEDSLDSGPTKKHKKT